MPTVVRTAPLTAAILALGFLAGCPDPKGSFQEFEGRVVDAAPIDLTDAPPLEEIPDISGSFYVAFTAKPAPSEIIHFIWDVQMTDNGDGTARVVVAATPLDFSTKIKIPPGQTLAEATVNIAGQFELVFSDFIIPALSNPIEGLGELTLDMKIATSIKSKDFICGVVTEGSVTSPLTADLVGSTFGGQRVPAGAEGAVLPPPHMNCDDPPPSVDAGVPDAGVDAGNPLDAGLDAAL